MNFKILRHNQRAPATQVIDSANKAALKTLFVAIKSTSRGECVIYIFACKCETYVETKSLPGITEREKRKDGKSSGM